MTLRKRWKELGGDRIKRKRKIRMEKGNWRDKIDRERRKCEREHNRKRERGGERGRATREAKRNLGGE